MSSTSRHLRTAHLRPAAARGTRRRRRCRTRGSRIARRRLTTYATWRYSCLSSGDSSVSLSDIQGRSKPFLNEDVNMTIEIALPLVCLFRTEVSFLFVRTFVRPMGVGAASQGLQDRIVHNLKSFRPSVATGPSVGVSQSVAMVKGKTRKATPDPRLLRRSQERFYCTGKWWLPSRG